MRRATTEMSSFRSARQGVHRGGCAALDSADTGRAFPKLRSGCQRQVLTGLVYSLRTMSIPAAANWRSEASGRKARMSAGPMRARSPSSRYSR